MVTGAVIGGSIGAVVGFLASVWMAQKSADPWDVDGLDLRTDADKRRGFVPTEDPNAAQDDEPEAVLFAFEA